MSSESNTSEKIKLSNSPNIDPSSQDSLPKNIKSLPESNYNLLTKIWRVKFYNLKENGEWDDKGIGHVFICEAFVEENNENSEKIHKLIMTKENSNEKIFDINLNDENIQFHNQRGTILTWKISKQIAEDDNAISFQEKAGVIEIWRYIMLIKDINSDDESFSINEDEQPSTDLEVSFQHLPILCNEFGKNMEEQKLNMFINILKETDYDFIKKLGKLLDEEEKKIECQRSSVVSLSLLSLETSCSMENNPMNNNKNKLNSENEEIKEQNISNPNNKNVKSIKNKIFESENLNLIFTLFKNLISIGNKELLEILLNDDCFLITFGALEYDFQSKKIVPHRHYFTEVVKFKNPLNITYKNIIKKINLNQINQWQN